MKRGRDEVVLPGTVKKAKGEEDEPAQAIPKAVADYSAWGRRPLPQDFSAATNDLVFQQMDIDYTMVSVAGIRKKR